MASEAFQRVLAKSLKIEGGYSDHRSDPGGKTMWGVTEALARKHGYQGRMQDLTLEEAARIYDLEFWQPLRLDEVHYIAPAIAEEVFDTGINMGTPWAALFLQQALNAFNMRGKLWPDLKEDGWIGPASINALKALAAKRGAEGIMVLNRALNSLQGARYISIARANQNLEDFEYGWFRTRIVI